MSRPYKSRNKVRVLVVDDYIPFANLLVGALGNEGYQARAAYSACEALRAAEDFKPHAVVLDAILRDMDGFKLAAEFERRLPACRVLLTSAWDYEREPAHVRWPYRVVHKAALMDELSQFLDSCGPSEEVGADYGGGQGLAGCEKKVCTSPAY